MTSETISPETVRAALEAATPGPYYVKYGDVYAGEQEVPVAMCDDTEAPLFAMAPDLATAYLALAEKNDRLRMILAARDAFDAGEPSQPPETGREKTTLTATEGQSHD
jgi:hypothetical protein